jgi:D-3-phosphoglycerate dehydrogenase / 2-oxoglutarate reductase
MKVLVTDYAWNDLEIERQALAAVSASIVAAKTGEEDELIQLAVEADGIFTNWKPVTRKVIANAPKCRVIVRYGVGLDNIAVQYATELGIMVANIPHYCIEEVSDHALALLLALARKVAFYDRSIKAGIYDLKSGTPMYRVRGKTLGLVGFGSIGRLLGLKAQALGMNVIVYNRGTRAAEEQVHRVSFEELLRTSDYISLHVPLTPQTRHLFDRETFEKMKPGAFLINTARGDVIDAEALLKALDDGLLAGAALDVLSKEPPDPADPLLLHPKTIITPHAAFNSEESLQDLRHTAASEMLAVLSGRLPQNLVNPEVIENGNLRAKLCAADSQEVK